MPNSPVENPESSQKAPRPEAAKSTLPQPGRPVPSRAYPVYAGAKSAVNIMTQAHAMEFGPRVRVNCIMCGPFWTDISKSWREEADANSRAAMKRIGRPEEIATTALYLASDKSSFTTGTIIRLDGCIP